MERRLPIGIEDFKEMIENDYYYVDKSGFVKELLDNRSEVSLLMRPRRFGKTLSLSMLKYYFEKAYVMKMAAKQITEVCLKAYGLWKQGSCIQNIWGSIR